MLNSLIVNALPLLPKSLVHIFAKKYIAGDNLDDAVVVTKNFSLIGGKTTIDVLGEFVTNKEKALHEKEMCSQVLDAISINNLPTYLSIKPTSLGLGLDVEFAHDNIAFLLEKAREFDIFVRIDMENSPYTTKTLDMYRRLRLEGYGNVGFVIQAYMRRSMADLKEMADLKPSVRLCKGIYSESEEIAYKKPDEIRDNYKRLLAFMLESGFHPAIATHDEELIIDAVNQLKQHGKSKEDYEFQMLLGVREERRDSLLRGNHNVRIYVPFGKDWYGYSVRRLKENPQMAGHIFKSLFTKN